MKLRLAALIMLLGMCLASVCAGGTLSRIYICPGDMMLRPRMQQQFQVFGLDSDGNDVAVPGPITWSASATAGTITSTGLFTASTSDGMYPNGVSATVPGGLSAVSVIEVVSVAPTGGYTLESSWGNYGAGHLNAPKGIAVGPTGTVYVSECFGSRISAFDASGNYMAMWGALGSIDSSHWDWSPGGLATDSQGNLYDADNNYVRIRKYSSSGAYLSSIGSYGSGDGQFMYLTDVAVDSNGFIYTLDSQLRRVQKFSPSGVFLLKWGTSGTGPDQLDSPNTLAVDNAGRVFVVEMFSNRVQVFDSSSGAFIAEWKKDGNNNNLFSSPSGIDTDSAGNVYVSQDSDQSVVKLDAQGNLLARWPMPWRNVNGLAVNSHIAVDSQGFAYVTVPQANSVVKLNSSGQQVASWGQQTEMKGRFNHLAGVVLDSAGNMYLLDYGGCRVQEFGPNRDFVTQWGSYGTGDGQFTSPKGIAIGPDGCLYILDASRVQKFSSTGQFLRKWGTVSNNRGGFGQPTDIAVDTLGNVYVSDTSRYKVLRFDYDGSFIDEWGSHGTGDSQFGSIWSIGVDGAGRVYVGDLSNNRIKKFDSAGTLMAQILPPTGSQIGYDGISFDSAGRMCVAASGRVDIYDPSGNLLKQVGTSGSDAGEFRGLEGVAVDSSGCIYAVEDLLSRISKFVPQLPASSTGKLRSLPEGQFVSIPGQIVTAGSSDIGSCFYIEAPDRSGAIKVTGDYGWRDATTSVDGNLATVNGELEIQATYVYSGDDGSVNALGIAAGKVGGGKTGLQDGVKGQQPNGLGYDFVPMSGLSNIGLLVKTCGKVISRDTASKTFFIRDGSGFDLKCKVMSVSYVPALNGYVSVTGISSTEKNATTGDVTPLLRVRMASDIRTM